MPVYWFKNCYLANLFESEKDAIRACKTEKIIEHLEEAIDDL